MTATVAGTAPSYRRAPKWVYRTGRGKVIISAPGLPPCQLQGASVAVWVVLDVPGSETEVNQRLAELGEFPPANLITETLELLLDAGFIEPTAR